MSQRIAICRLCLTTCDTVNVISSTQTDMLQIVLPDMDVHISNYTMICNGCTKTLDELFTFKSNVLEFEDSLHNYTKDGQEQVDLEDILGVNEIEETSAIKIKTRRVCRTCLKHSEHEVFMELTEGTDDTLKVCLPEMNIQMTKKLVVCPTCMNIIKNMFNFIKLGMKSEKMVKNYLQYRIGANANLQINIQDQLSRKPQNGAIVNVIGNNNKHDNNKLVILSNVVVKPKSNVVDESLDKHIKTHSVCRYIVDEKIRDIPVNSVSSSYNQEIADRSGSFDLHAKTKLGSNMANPPCKDVIIISDDESPVKKHNTKKSNSKIRTIPKIDPDPDYEVDSCESDSEEEEILRARVKRTKADKRHPVLKRNINNSFVTLPPSTVNLRKKRFYCIHCLFKTTDERTWELHNLRCLLNFPNLRSNKERVILEARNVNVPGERDLSIAMNTRNEPPAKRTEIVEEIESVESSATDTLTLMVKRDCTPDITGGNKKPVFTRDGNDLVIKDSFQRRIFSVNVLLKCCLCEFSTRFLTKIKEHLQSHSFINTYFTNDHGDGYLQIFYCGRCIRSFGNKITLQTHDCIKDNNGNTAMFKVGKIIYCSRCFFETDKEDGVLMHIEQCVGQYC